MKKVIIALSALILTAIPVILNSCEEEDNTEKCEAWAPTLNGYKTIYLYYQTSEDCLNYKEALETYLDWDCDNLDDDDFKTIMNSLPC